MYKKYPPEGLTCKCFMEYSSYLLSCGQDNQYYYFKRYLLRQLSGFMTNFNFLNTTVVTKVVLDQQSINFYPLWPLTNQYPWAWCLPLPFKIFNTVGSI